MTDGKFDAVAIEANETVMPSTTQPTTTSDKLENNAHPDLKRCAEEGAERAEVEHLEPDEDAGEERQGGAAPFRPHPVQVVINVDGASKLSAQEIAELVKALQSPPAS